MRLNRTSLAVLLLVAATGVARADWLVTTEGARVETKGAWKVKGSQVVFTAPNGTLSALRLADVDLDASAAATTRAKVPPPAPPPPPKPKAPAYVITEKDIPPAGATPAEETKEGAKGESGENKESLSVSSWDRADLPEGAGIEVFGTVSNNGETVATGGTITVSLYDDEGGLLVTESAELGPTAIPPGKTSAFRVQFPGLNDFGEARFAVATRGYRMVQPAPQAGETPAPSENPAPPEGQPPHH